VLIIFAYYGFVPIYFPIIMIARDVIVDAGRMHASSKGKVVPANIYGKLKTICQMVAILIIFFGLNGNFIRDNNRMINFYL
jgi:CDP-diacylglycerol--glycerol-3-phosphate 3-phosphatidyltransferase